MSRAASRLIGFADSACNIKAAVECIVERLLDGVRCPATDLDAVMHRLDVDSAITDPSLSGSGALRQLPDGTVQILVSPFQSKVRERFTIAHELGHVIFMRTGRGWPRRGRDVERLCDRLATELLMPRRIFHAQFHELPTLSAVRSAASLFQTSLVASTIRCSEIFGLGCFEIENGYWRWARGLAKELPVRLVSGNLDAMIESAIESTRGAADIWLHDRGHSKRFIMEWQGNHDGHRHLFVVRPRGQSE